MRLTPRGFVGVLILGVAVLAAAATTNRLVSQVPPQGMRRPAIEQVVDLPTRPGRHVRALVVRPDAPIGSVVLLAGGHGNLNLQTDGRIGWGAHNQLVRTRQGYAVRGLAVIVPDIAEDFKVGSGASYDYRWSEAHAQDLAALTAFAAQIAKPVFLVGTSRAALSVANLASRPELQPQPDAMVITSGMLMDVGNAQPSVQRNVPHVERMRGPMLALFHRDDQCPSTPASSAERFRSLASGARPFEIKLLSGGTPSRLDPCEHASAHGFLGLDNEVVDTIVTWLGKQRR